MYVIPLQVKGYQSYEPVRRRLRQIFDKAFILPYPAFTLAVNEAVCNAARYAVDGPKKAMINIQVSISEAEIVVIVASKTRPFDAKDYQKKLQELAADKATGSMEWGEYTGVSERSRGFWYMLEACEYVIIEADGSSITLSASIPHVERLYHPTIETLVPRFLVMEKGVIVS